MSGQPPVEVVIAVHHPGRPVGRAVASVLDDNGDQACVTVVAHGLPQEQIAAVIREEHRDRVRLIEHHDGIRSAAGPFNAGMVLARGQFVSLLGSDDVLAPGAVASWLSLAAASGAECVISALAYLRTGRRVPTPPVRPTLRRGSLADPVADRLSYRSAPLGLVSTAARDRLGAQLAEGLPVGDDMPYVTRLWCETRVVVDRDGPPYLIGEDANDRISYAARPIADELALLPGVVDTGWFAGYPETVRQAVATKLLRIHVFGAVLHRSDPAWWTPAERRALAVRVSGVLAAVPRAARPLSLADRELVDACLDPRVPAARLVTLARDRRRHGRPRTLLTRDPAYLLHREGPVRMMAASWWAGR